MKKPSTQALKWSALATALLIVLVRLLTVQRSQKLLSSLRSGRFEARYTSAIDELQTQTRAVRDKLRANMPGDLEILPEELLRALQPAHLTDETPGELAIENVTLRGIYWSETMPLAEINNRLCKSGDKIAGFTVEKIEPYQIILSDANGTNHTVTIIKESFHTETTK